MTDKPHRVQLSRAKGWKMPPNTVSVARPTRWGNPWRAVNEAKWRNGWVVLDPDWIAQPKRHYMADRLGAILLAIQEHEVWMRGGFGPNVQPLRGKNLACWCALEPRTHCHADVLLELANEP